MLLILLHFPIPLMVDHTITISVPVIIFIVVGLLFYLQHCSECVAMCLQFGLIHLRKEVERFGVAPLGQASLDAFGGATAVLMVCVAQVLPLASHLLHAVFICEEKGGVISEKWH